ncbi:MAG TPA: hypothetical protein VGB59_12860 [Allosphingosinicella sp.]|jgi:hypothetical protein
MAEKIVELSIEETEAVSGGSGYTAISHAAPTAPSDPENRSGYIGAGS